MRKEISRSAKRIQSPCPAAFPPFVDSMKPTHPMLATTFILALLTLLVATEPAAAGDDLS
jgi:hypothetical protein